MNKHVKAGKRWRVVITANKSYLLDSFDQIYINYSEACAAFASLVDKYKIDLGDVVESRETLQAKTRREKYEYTVWLFDAGKNELYF